MAGAQPYAGRNDHLSRLDRGYYRGFSFVHWTMAINERRTGWLIPVFYYKFREILTHTMFRYSLACPIYCAMPDHIHMVWIGLHENSDQLNATKFFRKQLATPLATLGFALQHQCYDHVLRDDEKIETAFSNLVEYIARNPERKQLVPTDHFREYKFTGCLVPGYPEFTPWLPDYWERFWRTCSFLKKNGLLRLGEENDS